MRKAAKVEVIIVGNEILTGDILDMNTNWLCRLVHGRVEGSLRGQVFA